MMSRLEEIKQRLVLLHNAADVDDETKNYIFEDLKVEWLIERVQGLEGDKKALGVLIEETAKIAWNIEQQNKRYRKIIQDFIDYADDYNIAKAEKYHLRKALESEE